jgi:hypothetical protein
MNLGAHVNVFDEITLDVVLGELDTISDFVTYLRAKETFFSSTGRVMCAGEDDLLAFYLENLDEAGNFLPEQVREFTTDSYGMIHIAEGIWDQYGVHP